MVPGMLCKPVTRMRSSLLALGTAVVDRSGRPTAGTEWAESATVVLWYITTLPLVVLLSPLAWWAYRRLPLLTLAMPLLVLARLETRSGEVRTAL